MQKGSFEVQTKLVDRKNYRFAYRKRSDSPLVLVTKQSIPVSYLSASGWRALGLMRDRQTDEGSILSWNLTQEEPQYFKLPSEHYFKPSGARREVNITNKFALDHEGQQLARVVNPDLMIYHPMQGTIAAVFPYGGLNVSDLLFSDDGTLLTIQGYSRVVLIDVPTQQVRFCIDLPRSNQAVAFTPRNEALVTADYRGQLYFLDVQTAHIRGQVQINAVTYIGSAIFTDEGRTLLFYTGRGVQQLDLSTGRITIAVDHDGYLTQLQYASQDVPGGRRRAIVAALTDGPHGPRRLKLWDAQRGAELPGPAMQIDHNDEVALRHDGQLLAVNTAGKIELWDLDDPTASLRSVDVTPSHDRFFNAQHLVFDAQGARLAWGNVQLGQVQVWDLRSNTVTTLPHPEPEETLLGDPFARPRTLRFSPNGRWLAFYSGIAIRLWDMERQQYRVSGFGDHLWQGRGSWSSRTVTALTFSPDSRWLAAGNEGGSIDVWDISAMPPRSEAESTGASGFARFLPKALLTPSRQFLSLKSTKEFLGHTAEILDLAFAHDAAGRLLLRSVSADGVVREWAMQEAGASASSQGQAASPSRSATAQRGDADEASAEQYRTFHVVGVLFFTDYTIDQVRNRMSEAGWEYIHESDPMALSIFRLVNVTFRRKRRPNLPPPPVWRVSGGGQIIKTVLFLIFLVWLLATMVTSALS